MFDLKFGASIIDSPGIKGFGLIDIEKNELGDYFPEFILYKSNCKFNNCLHENEADLEFYEFLNHSSLLLNETQDNLRVFSPWILLKSTKYFGFKPRFNRSSSARFFNLQTGDFIANKGESNTLSANDSDVLMGFYNASYPTNKLFHSLDLLAIALKYYQLQNQSFRNLKTLSVLKAVFA